MSLDRTGEPVEPHDCRSGWLTPPDSDSPRLCPICRPQRRSQADADPTPSARALAAIERADREDPHA